LSRVSDRTDPRRLSHPILLAPEHGLTLLAERRDPLAHVSTTSDRIDVPFGGQVGLDRRVRQRLAREALQGREHERRVVTDRSRGRCAPTRRSAPVRRYIVPRPGRSIWRSPRPRLRTSLRHSHPGPSRIRRDWREDVGGMGVPLRGRDGRVVAALSVSGPVDRFRPTDIERHAPHLLRAGREISLELGWREA